MATGSYSSYGSCCVAAFVRLRLADRRAGFDVRRGRQFTNQSKPEIGDPPTILTVNYWHQSAVSRLEFGTK